MNTEVLHKWSREAWAVEARLDTLRVPFHVLAGEALAVVRFAKRYWDPGHDESGNVSRPGLGSAIGAGRFSDGIADEIQSHVIRSSSSAVPGRSCLRCVRARILLRSD